MSSLTLVQTVCKVQKEIEKVATSREIKYTYDEWAVFFPKARYMIGIGFKIQARTPVPKSPQSYNPHPSMPYIGNPCGNMNTLGQITRKTD